MIQLRVFLHSIFSWLAFGIALLCITIVFCGLVTASFFELNTSRPLSFFSLSAISNYSTIVYSSEFWLSFSRSLEVSIFTIVISTTLGALATWAIFSANKYTTAAFLGCMLVPLFLPPTTVALIWYFQLNPNYGVIGYHASTIANYEFLNFENAQTSIVAIECWRLVPFLTLSMYINAKTTAASLSNSIKIYQIKPSLALLALFVKNSKNIALLTLFTSFLLVIKSFESIFILTSGGPGDATNTIPVYLYRLAFQKFNIGISAAASIIYTVLLYSILTLALLSFRRGE